MKATILIVGLLMSLALHLHGQSKCECPRKEAYTQLAYQSDTMRQMDQKFAILRDRVHSERHPGCRFIAMRLLADHTFRDGKLDSAKYMLRDLRRHMQSLSCQDSFYVGFLETQIMVYSFGLETDSTILAATTLLELGKRLGRKGIMSRAYLEIASAYMLAQDFDHAIPYARLAVRYVGDIPAPKSRIRIYGESSRVYTNYYGNKPERLPCLDTAAYLATQALEIMRNLQLKTTLANGFEKLAKIKLVQRQYDECLRYLDSAEAFIPDKAYGSVRAKIAADRADVFSERGQYARAVKELQGNLHHIPAYDPSQKRIYYKMIYAAAKAAGDPATALDALERHRYLQDSIFTEDKARAARDFEARYQKVEQDAQIRELSQAQELDDLRIRSLSTTILAVAILAVAVIVTLSLWYRQRLLRSRQALHQAEQRLNRARINPHVFFNMLTTLQTMSLDPRNASALPGFLARYSRLMRITLETTYAELITLEMELQYLEDYLALQELRIPGRFSHKIEIDPDIDPSEVKVPSLIFQPLAENAIEHGFRHMQAGGQITIHVHTQGGGILAIVDDNGQAEEEEAVSNHEGFPSRATQIMEDRITLINARLRRRTQMALHRQALSQGYRVELTIPRLA